MKVRRYANGFDWVAAGLNAACRRLPGGGNHFLLAFHFDRPVSAGELAELFGALPESVLGRLHGEWRRAWNLAPYWKSGQARNIEISELNGTLETFADQPLPPRAALTAAVSEKGGEWGVVFKFSHLLFDGAGAELFCRALFGDPTVLEVAVRESNGPSLNNWRRLIGAGGRLNRMTIAISRKKPSGIPAVEDAGGIRYQCAELSAPALAAAADKLMGPFSLAALTAGAVARGVWRWGAIHPERWQDGRMVIPMSISRRSARDGDARIFFNYWSILPLWWDANGEERNLKWWAGEAKARMVEFQIARLPEDFETANLPMRILPPSLEGKLAVSRFDGGAGTVMFSLLPETQVPETWGARRILNVRHLPLMPARPGMGFFFTRCGDHLNLVLSSRRNLLDDTEAEELFAAVRRELHEILEQS